MIEQGDIIKIEDIDDLVVVISKNVYNKTGNVIACPMVKSPVDSIFSYKVDLMSDGEYIICDNIQKINLLKRKYVAKAKLPMSKLLLVIDMVQALVDYY